MKHHSFILASLVTLTACAGAPLAPASNTAPWLPDDDSVELTPEYNVQYVQGEANSQAIAAFHHWPSKKLVRLRPGASISVNGTVLEEVLGTHGAYFYRAQLPTTSGAFTFTLLRAPAKTMTHRFELPSLGLTELPKVYQPYERLRVPVKYVEPPQYVTSDSYSMAIYGPWFRFGLTSSVRKKDNFSFFERLPDIQGDSIVFRHIIDSAPQPGIYQAEIFRQHNVALGKMSDVSATGWARLSNTQLFKIEVRRHP
jgi:hypothetical protein